MNIVWSAHFAEKETDPDSLSALWKSNADKLLAKLNQSPGLLLLV
jgi:hypothetical protein